MHNWFECKITYDKTQENGVVKRVTEPYLVDALSFTEAEARIVEELRLYMSGEFYIADIKRAKLSEIFFNESGDRYFKAKVFFITLDEKSGSEKRTAVQMLAQASDIKEALAVVEKGMEGTLADYVIGSLSETNIMDIFPYSSEEKESSPAKISITFKKGEKEIPISLQHLELADKMIKAKEFVKNHASTPERVLQVRQMQTIIRSKSDHNPDKYLETTIKYMDEHKDDASMMLFILGCCSLLLEDKKEAENA